jgi:hypothetical protein
VAEEYGEIGERHSELLWVVADLASNDPAAIAQMYRAAQRMNLNTVGKQAGREAFLALVRDLEGAGCVEARGADLAASFGMLAVTRKGIGSWKQPRSVERPRRPRRRKREQGPARPPGTSYRRGAAVVG